jgi:hypothetical protein
MNRILFVCVAVLVLFSCNNGTVHENIEAEVTAINSKCPKMIDSETRIDGVELLKSNTIVYKYTLINLSAANLDTAGFRSAMWPGILSTIRINPGLKDLRENETTFRYLYLDRDGKKAYEFTVTPRQYK